MECPLQSRIWREYKFIVKAKRWEAGIKPRPLNPPDRLQAFLSQLRLRPPGRCGRIAGMKLPEKLKKAWSGLSFRAANARLYLLKVLGYAPSTKKPTTTRVKRRGRKSFYEVADSIQLMATGVARAQDVFERSVLTGYIAKRNRVTSGKGHHKFIHPSTPA